MVITCALFNRAVKVSTKVSATNALTLSMQMKTSVVMIFITERLIRMLREVLAVEQINLLLG